MGPSGAGKDSLIEAALATKLPSLIAIPRLVTRASSPESHDSQVTPEYFLELERRNRLSLSWASHGYLYGLEKTLEDELAKGQVVIVNGSRQYLPEAKRRFPALKAVLITAEEKILKARLEKRARENASSIEERLSRTNESLIEPDADLVVIDNSKTLQNALEPFLELLKGHWPIQSPES
jgi:ribose 1,5-bisphosphokinase